MLAGRRGADWAQEKASRSFFAFYGVASELMVFIFIGWPRILFEYTLPYTVYILHGAQWEVDLAGKNGGLDLSSKCAERLFLV